MRVALGGYITQLKTWLQKTDFKTLALEKSKDPVFWLRFFAYAIPFSFFIYILYINFLPFGFEKTYMLDIGSDTDTDLSELYIEPSRYLSDKQEVNEKKFRTLFGHAIVIFEPIEYLVDSTLHAQVIGTDVFIVQPEITTDVFKNSNVVVDLNFNNQESFTSIIGNTYMFDQAAYFDGKNTKIELPDTENKFESGDFGVYVTFKPRNKNSDYQQIIGHYNWEIFQNKDSVYLQVGKMEGNQGKFYSIEKKIDDDFFNKEHNIFFIYSESKDQIVDGYIDLYLDNILVERKSIGFDKIDTNYNAQRNVSIGKSDHGVSKYYNGYISKVVLIDGTIENYSQSTDWDLKETRQEIYLYSKTESELDKIEMYARKK
jgi:hypothetical protein